MDVKCQQCGVEYEFDDERVNEDGVTVKCTNCGHIFKVKREVRVVTEPVIEPGAISGDWMVRQASGNVFTFKELTTLQRWIVERKVARNDEISKTGKTWKRLGDIAELASFFQVVDDAARTNVDIHAAATLPPNVMIATPGGVSPGYTYAPVAAPPAYSAAALPFDLATPTQPDAVPVVAGYGPAAALPPQPAVAPVAAPVAPWQQPVAPPRIDLELDDEDPVRDWQKKRRWPWLVLLLLVLLGGGVAGLYFAAPDAYQELLARAEKLLKGELPPAVTQAIAGARAATRLDVIADLEQSASVCRGAIGQAPDEAALLAAQASVEIALAAAQRDLYDLYKLQIAQLAAAGGADATELKALANRASDAAALHFKAGFEAMQKALTLSADDVTAVLAAADYYRLNNRFDQVQQLLTRAQPQIKPGDDRSKLIEALAQATQPELRAAAAPALVALVAGDSKLGRARWALVQLREASGDLAGGQTAANELLSAIPGHERARLWLAAHAVAGSQPAVAASAPASAPATPVATKPPIDQPGGEQPLVEKPAGERPVGPVTKPAVDKPAGEGGEPVVAAGGGYDGLIAKADRLRENGNTAAAIKLYNRAVELNPGGPEALAGQGWCYLDKSQNAMALSSFQAALDANANYADAHMGLAEAWRARQNKQKAVAEYKKYVELGGPEAEIAKRAIEELSR